MTGCLGIIIMCPSGAICITVDSCFSELVLYKSNMTATTDKALTAKEVVNPATIQSRPQQRPLFEILTDCTWKKLFHQVFLEIRLIGQNKNELPVDYMLCRWDRFPNIIVLFKWLIFFKHFLLVMHFYRHWYVCLFVCLFVCLMVFNANFNNISVISWLSVL